jgi:hypothetical protein
MYFAIETNSALSSAEVDEEQSALELLRLLFSTLLPSTEEPLRDLQLFEVVAPP